MGDHARHLALRAAVSGAGMSDLAAEFSTEVHPAYDEWFYGLPYEKPDGFRHSSPLTYIKMRTHQRYFAGAMPM